MACQAITNFFDSPKERSKGKYGLTVFNDSCRSLFKIIVSSTILFDDRFRAITFPLSFAYAATAPSTLKTSWIANAIAKKLHMPKEKFINKVDAFKDVFENGIDHFSLLYASYTAFIGILNTAGTTPTIFLHPAVPAILASIIILGSAGYYWKNKGKEQKISEKLYAVSIARNGAGFLATFYFEMLLVLGRKTFDLFNLGVALAIFGLAAGSYRSERKYAEKERALNQTVDAENLLNTNSLQEPKANRNLYARLSESFKSGWFFTASLFSFATWIINMSQGNDFNKTGPTLIPDAVAITFFMLGLGCFGLNFAKGRIPPGYEAYCREKENKSLPILENHGSINADMDADAIVEEKVEEARSAFSV